MFYSKTIDEIKINFFLNLLSHKIAGDAIKEDAYIEAIIADASALAREEKSFFEIDRDGYPIVVALYEHDKEYFKDVDVRTLGRSDFERMHKLLLNEPEFA